MAVSIASRFKNAFNIFMHPDRNFRPEGPSYSTRPDRHYVSYGNDKSIVTVLYNRIAMDAASVDIQHVRLDEENRFLETIDSELNSCLTLSANVDQTGRALIQDVVLSMLDEGVVALVPIDTDEDPKKDSFEIYSFRVGKIVEWYPMDVRVSVYDERNGKTEEIIVSKEHTAIVENPFYSVINRPNSTMKRLMRKLSLLDLLDERIASGKLDIIIQLPYMVKGESRRNQAEMRRQAIEEQLVGGKYGIAYIDASEHITQLNRPAENAFTTQVKDLTDMVYNQLGMSKEILDGTADEKTMQNYYTRTVEPIVAALTDEMKRKFLTKTARTQGQSIMAFRDPFKLMPVSAVAETADKFIRNEILTPNEFRQIIGRKPVADEKADQLRNPNISQTVEEQVAQELGDEMGVNDISVSDMTEEDFAQAFADLDAADEELDDLEAELNGGEIRHYASPYYDPVKAHEYYMKNRELKGRSSTSGLNEEGKKAASYIRQQLINERKRKVSEHKDYTNSEIAKSKEAMDAGIAKSKEAKDSGIAKSKEAMSASIAARQEKASQDLATEKEVTKQSISDYKDHIYAKIDVLRERLKGMSKADKEKNKDAINAEIAKLRDDNKAQREKLNAAYKEFSATQRATRTTENAADRATHKETSANLRDAHKETSTNLRNAYKETSANLRDAHKEKAASLKNEYDNKYYNELDRLRATPSFQKKKKK